VKLLQKIPDSRKYVATTPTTVKNELRKRMSRDMPHDTWLQIA
jgi:hypothetical protein